MRVTTPLFLATVIRALAAIVVLVTSLVGLSGPASACSCDSGQAPGMLAVAEASFIGTFSGNVALEDLSGDTDGGEVGFRFEVERYLSGDFTAPSIAVAVALDGCGFESVPTAPMAIFLYGTEDGIPNTNQCMTIGAESARRSLATPLVDPAAGDASMLMFAPVQGDAPHLWLADSQGRTAGFAYRPETVDDSVHLREVSLCPGDAFVVETWGDKLVVRDLATLQVVSTNDTFAPAICLDAEASEFVRVHSRVGATTLFLPDTEEPVRLTGDHGYEVLAALGKIVTYDSDGVYQVDLDGTITAIWQPEAGVLLNTQPVEAISVDPDGSQIAFATWSWSGAELPVAIAVMADLETGAIRETTFPRFNPNRLHWLSPELLWLGNTHTPRQWILDTELVRIEDQSNPKFTSANWEASIIQGGLNWRIDRSVLYGRDLDAAGANEEIVGSLHIPIYGQIKRLSTPIHVTADLPTGDSAAIELGTLPVETDSEGVGPESVPPGTDDAEDAQEASAKPDGETGPGGDRPIWLLGLMAITVTGAALVMRLLSRSRRSRAGNQP